MTGVSGIYTRVVEGRVRIVSLEGFREGDKSGRNWCVIARLPYPERDNGLPAGEDLSRLCELESEIANQVKPSGAVWLGHITGGGRFCVYFYSRQPAPPTVRVKAGLLKSDEIALESVEDPNWEVYSRTLESDPLEFEMLKNFTHLYVLEGEGDLHALPRSVDFAFSFNSDTDRANFIEKAKGLGYKVTQTWEPEAQSYWCELVVETSVEPEVIAGRCRELRQMANRNAGDLDGWGCTVTN